LKEGLKKRTEEANQTIMKLVQQNKDTQQKNNEYLQVIEQLSTEVVKLQRTL